MKIFMDSEFIEDGKTIELISIALVREDGAEYYAEVEGVDYSRADAWVQEHVIKNLTGETKPREVIAREIIEFVGENPEFWAYYCSYDWVVLCQLYGRMIDLPEGWPKRCNDVKQLQASLPFKHENPPDDESMAHNALYDTRWLKLAYDKIIEAKEAYCIKHGVRPGFF